jgi:hypothetical protein
MQIVACSLGSNAHLRPTCNEYEYTGSGLLLSHQPNPRKRGRADEAKP